MVPTLSLRESLEKIMGSIPRAVYRILKTRLHLLYEAFQGDNAVVMMVMLVGETSHFKMVILAT